MREITNFGRGCSFSFYNATIDTIQKRGYNVKDNIKKACGQRLHVQIDRYRRMPNLIRLKATAGWKYNLTHYSQG